MVLLPGIELLRPSKAIGLCAPYLSRPPAKSRPLSSVLVKSDFSRMLLRPSRHCYARRREVVLLLKPGTVVSVAAPLTVESPSPDSMPGHGQAATDPRTD
jgi:hypothetical protein